jgi:hypothetical protein
MKLEQHQPIGGFYGVKFHPEKQQVKMNNGLHL